MKRKHVLHKENCECKVRASIKTRGGNIISLMGQHGFGWDIVETVMGNNNRIIITSFPSSVEAKKAYKLKTKYIK